MDRPARSGGLRRQGSARSPIGPCLTPLLVLSPKFILQFHNRRGVANPSLLAPPFAAEERMRRMLAAHVLAIVHAWLMRGRLGVLSKDADPIADNEAPRRQGMPASEAAAEQRDDV